MQRGKILELGIERMVFEGKALARAADGKDSYVEGALPGERVLAEVFKEKRDYRETRTVEVLQPSPYRVAPACSHFGRCGGCTLQFASYEGQLRFKEGFLSEALTRIGKLEEVPLQPIVPSQAPFGYRNKMEFSFAEEDGLRLGLHPRGNFRRVVDLRECPISGFPADQYLPRAKSWAVAEGLPAWDVKGHFGCLRNLLFRTSATLGTLMVDLIGGETLSREAAQRFCELWPGATVLITNNQAWGDSHRVDQQQIMSGEGILFEELDGLRFRLSPRSFFQTNTWGALNLYREVQACVRESGARRVLDLYCGTGTITCFIGRELEEIWGVEMVAESVEDARGNAARNGLEQVHFRQGLVEKILPELGSFQLAVLDPPRCGLHPQTLAFLAEGPFPWLVYLSCNPASLARDLRWLAARYRLIRVTPFDLFPQTYHVEGVAFLQRIT
ncbi:MAG: 23S rRNA (uracil(1939)-C(5))-methyltransferase RlmD [Coprothermobacterota bacterium]|nr:23S rRNA (uracil(1939)-C(5))-methyltransferase RlmD [Coprothermobacterota bacterium]